VTSVDADRRLAAILCADIAGYARLMENDEEGTVRTLRAWREQITALVAEHRGRIADFSGDDFLAEEHQYKRDFLSENAPYAYRLSARAQRALRLRFAGPTLSRITRARADLVRAASPARREGQHARHPEQPRAAGSGTRLATRKPMSSPLSAGA
jgi:class 3 adenylate cyclase